MTIQSCLLLYIMNGLGTLGGSRVLEKGGSDPIREDSAKIKGGFGPYFRPKMLNFPVILKKFEEKGGFGHRTPL